MTSEPLLKANHILLQDAFKKQKAIIVFQAKKVSDGENISLIHHFGTRPASARTGLSSNRDGIAGEMAPEIADITLNVNGAWSEKASETDGCVSIKECIVPSCLRKADFFLS